MTSFDYRHLDPGIRCVVRLLHRWHYETTDSGDGKTKQSSGLYDESDLIPVPHVVITGFANLRLLKSTALGLMLDLREEGIVVSPQGEPGASIQYDFCPASNTSTILLMDLSDDDLPDELRTELEKEIESLRWAPCVGPEGCDECRSELEKEIKEEID